MKFSATLSILFILASCDSSNLASESVGDFGSLVRIICDEAVFDQSQYDDFFTDLPDEDRIPIEKRLNQKKADCSWLQPIQAKSDQLYEELTDGLHFPVRLYSFKFEFLRNDFSQGRSAGYFKSAEECDSYRESFGDQGFQAEECEATYVF